MVITDWMRNRWVWILVQFSRRIWVRATIFAVLSVLAALLAPLIEPIIPDGLPERLGAASVGDILKILASSMLVVATFSLGTLISAFAVASSSTTPRVTELLMQDTQAQNAIAIFVGAFLFALVGIIGLSAGLYGTRGSVLLFLTTLVVVVVVITVFLRWVDLVAHIGRVPDAIDRTADAVEVALADRLARPCLGGAALTAARGPVMAVSAGCVGFLRHLDVPQLEKIGESMDAMLRVRVLPGAFVGLHSTLVEVEGDADEACVEQIRAAFDIGPRRSFDLDPRYGLLTLAEIGIKALSPGINDPGTAINVLGALTRVLSGLETTTEPEAPTCSHVQAPELEIDDLFGDAFDAIGRDGAHQFEVQIRLLKSLRLLADSESREIRAAALACAETAAARARDALELDAERRRIAAQLEEIRERLDSD